MITLGSQNWAASHRRFLTAVWLMNTFRCLAILALLFPSMAEAASVIKPIVACRDEVDSKKGSRFPRQERQSGTGQIQRAKDNEGRLPIAIERHDRDDRHEGRQALLRAPDADINQNPAEPEAHQGAHSGGGHRRGGGGGGGNFPQP
jgi:hypothetical protein